MILGVVGSVYTLLVSPHKMKREAMRKQVQQVERLLQEKKAERNKLNKLVYDLNHDPATIEKVAREKFGLCKPNEKIYKY